MKGLEIYVKSSALGGSGIYWRKVSDSKQHEEIPSILEKRIIPKKTGGFGTINYLVNETKPSCILVRYNGLILLEITGIESPERSKLLGRRVLNSVVWVVDENPDDEQILRELAARALMSFWGKYPEFINTVNSAIEFDGLEGFKGNFEVIKELAANGDKKLKLLLSDREKFKSDNQEAIWEAKQKQINSDAQIDSFANQLATSPLPEGKDLVVVAEMLAEGVILYKGIVWEETVSNEVLNPSPRSDELPPTPQPFPASASTPVAPSSPAGKKKEIIRPVVAILLLIVGMSSVWWVLNQRQETSQKIPIPQILIIPQPEIPIPQLLITPQPQTKPSLPTQPNRRTKPQLQPNQQPRKTP